MAFSSKCVFTANPSFISAIAEEICLQLQTEDYTIEKKKLFSGGVCINISKGGFFKVIIGMKTALKITITPEKSRIIVEVDSCIFALQAIPSVISILLFWPLVITQTWGLLQQSKLNEYVMDLIKKSLQQIVESSKGTATNGSPCFG